jgi:hypothetical protein
MNALETRLSFFFSVLDMLIKIAAIVKVVAE